jgi:hypothetical protein
MPIHGHEPLLNLQPGEPGYAHVENNATGSSEIRSLEQQAVGLSRRFCLSGGAAEAGHNLKRDTVRR